MLLLYMYLHYIGIFCLLNHKGVYMVYIIQCKPTLNKDYLI